MADEEPYQGAKQLEDAYVNDVIRARSSLQRLQKRQRAGEVSLDLLDPKMESFFLAFFPLWVAFRSTDSVKIKTLIDNAIAAANDAKIDSNTLHWTLDDTVINHFVKVILIPGHVSLNLLMGNKQSQVLDTLIGGVKSMRDHFFAPSKLKLAADYNDETARQIGRDKVVRVINDWRTSVKNKAKTYEKEAKELCQRMKGDSIINNLNDIAKQIEIARKIMYKYCLHTIEKALRNKYGITNWALEFEDPAGWSMMRYVDDILEEQGKKSIKLFCMELKEKLTSDFNADF